MLKRTHSSSSCSSQDQAVYAKQAAPRWQRALRTESTPTMLAMQRRGDSFHRLFDSVALPLLSQPHSTALPSPKQYDKRYELRSLSGETLNSRRFTCPIGQAIYACIRESGVGFFAGVCTLGDQVCISSDPPPTPPLDSPTALFQPCSKSNTGVSIRAFSFLKSNQPIS
jgi:hypothetical protein